ncbi:hypothetical protein YC2023_122074 [Brassica napus]
MLNKSHRSWDEEVISLSNHVIPVSQFGNMTASSSFQSNQDESLSRSPRSDRARRVLGRYVATELWLELGRYVATELGRAWSLRSDRAGRSLGRYVATELWLELGRYVATERYDRSVAT